MKKGIGHGPRAWVFVVGLAVGVALLPSLSACVLDVERTPLHSFIDAIGESELFLDDETRQQLDRFEGVYRQYVMEGSGGAAKGLHPQMEHFRDAYFHIRKNYVHDVAGSKLIDAAITGIREADPALEPGSVEPAVVVEKALDAMTASLDPHSSYLNPDELNEMKVSTRGEFGGLGIEVTMQDGFVKVVSPIEDTPAFRAGLKSGDLITHLDGDPVKGKSLLDAVRVMRGKPGQPIKLTINRADTAPFDVVVVRAVIKVKAVKWRLEGDVGYIRVSRFSERVQPGIREAMDDINHKLGQRLQGVVLDLRNNPGGLLHQSLALSDAFLEQGIIVSVKGREATSERVFGADEDDMARGKPLVVLINRGSASAAEIVAGALQDNHRAVVMGRRSFGKGSVQTIMPLSLEGALRLTSQLYYSPSGRAIQARGVLPDIELVPVPEKPKDDEDVQTESNTEVKAPRREADLPGAISAVGEDAKNAAKLASLSEAQCEAIGEREDRALGCALALLRAGSADKFLASVETNPQM